MLDADIMALNDTVPHKDIIRDEIEEGVDVLEKAVAD